MKNQIYIAIFFLFVSLSSGRCKKSGNNCSESLYSFEGYANVLNPFDSVSVGDTIWLDISVPITQVDARSGQSVSFRNASNLGTAIGFGELVSPTTPVYAANDFNYVLIKGIIVNNPNTQLIREYTFIETAIVYEFKLGIIPKRKGVFNFGLSNASNVFRKDDKCTKAAYKIFFKNTPLHLYLVKEAFGTMPDSSYTSPYCFKVK